MSLQKLLLGTAGVYVAYISSSLLQEQLYIVLKLDILLNFLQPSSQMLKISLAILDFLYGFLPCYVQFMDM